MFPQFNTQQPNQNPGFNLNQNQGLNMGTYPNYAGNMGGNPGGVLLPNNQILEQYSQSNLTQLVKFVSNCISSQDIEYMVPFLVHQQAEIIKQIEESTKMEGVYQYDEKYLKQIKQRCIRLKIKNQTILMEMFTIKEKIGRVMSLNMTRDTDSQAEFSFVQDKIRKVKIDIVNKLQHIKTQRLLDLTINKGVRKQNRRNNFAPINIALTELKDATEVLDRELIRQRQQIRAIIKQLYDESV